MKWVSRSWQLVAGGEALVLQRVYQAAGEGVIHQDKLLFVRRSWASDTSCKSSCFWAAALPKEREHLHRLFPGDHHAHDIAGYIPVRLDPPGMVDGEHGQGAPWTESGTPVRSWVAARHRVSRIADQHGAGLDPAGQVVLHIAGDEFFPLVPIRTIIHHQRVRQQRRP